MGLRLVYQSPYSPDLNLCYRFLFTRLKDVVRPVQYDSNDEVVKSAQHCLRSLSDYYLINEFHKFLGHCKATEAKIFRGKKSRNFAAKCRNAEFRGSFAVKLCNFAVLSPKKFVI